MYFDLDFSSNPGNESSIYQFQETRSQEFRFSSVDDSMIEWSAGLYYGDTEIEGSLYLGFQVFGLELLQELSLFMVPIRRIR